MCHIRGRKEKKFTKTQLQLINKYHPSDFVGYLTGKEHESLQGKEENSEKYVFLHFHLDGS